MSDLINRQGAISALLEKGQRSRRYKLGENWELNFDEIREALTTVPSAGNEAERDELRDRLNKCHEYIDKLENELICLEARRNEADELRDQLKNRLDYIAVLEAKCRDLTEKLHETELAVEHNRHLADEEQLRGGLRYRDGVIHGLKYAIRCNGVSGGEVDQ